MFESRLSRLSKREFGAPLLLAFPNISFCIFERFFRLVFNSPAARDRVSCVSFRRSLSPKCKFDISLDTAFAPVSANVLRFISEGSWARLLIPLKNSPIRVLTVALLGNSTSSRRFKISDFDLENENDEDAFCNCKSKNWSNALVMPPIRTPKPLVFEIVKISELAKLISSIEASRRA